MTLELDTSMLHILHFGAGLKMAHEAPLIYRLIEHGPKKLVFQNTSDDPIHYIIYQRTSKGELTVSLLTKAGKVAETFTFHLVNAC